MTNVRIRHEDDAVAQPLTEVPFNQLDDIISTLKEWGIADEEDSDLSGQFVYGDRGAYFEVVIHRRKDT